MSTFLVLGAGRMAAGIIADLTRPFQDTLHTVHVYDNNRSALVNITETPNKFHSHTIFTKVHDCSRAEPSDIPKDVQVIISTLPYDYSYIWSKAAMLRGIDFIDLGGNNDMVAKQRTLHEKAKSLGSRIIPDCGLAPGLVSILAMDLVQRNNIIKEIPGRFPPFSIEISVGGLPLVRDNPLEYQIVFSPHGLINEYIEPTLILQDGQLVTVPSMTDIEKFSMPWGFTNLEKFYTSGGASTLPKSLQNICNNISYKTIRYAGHAQKMRLLLDLFLGEREQLEKLLELALPLTGPDVVLLEVKLIDDITNVLVDSHTIIDFAYNGLTAMARMTAFPASIIAQALANNIIGSEGGVLTQEELFGDAASVMVKELKRRGIRFLE